MPKTLRKSPPAFAPGSCTARAPPGAAGNGSRRAERLADRVEEDLGRQEADGRAREVGLVVGVGGLGPGAEGVGLRLHDRASPAGGAASRPGRTRPSGRRAGRGSTAGCCRGSRPPARRSPGPSGGTRPGWPCCGRTAGCRASASRPGRRAHRGRRRAPGLGPPGGLGAIVAPVRGWIVPGGPDR